MSAARPITHLWQLPLAAAEAAPASDALVLDAARLSYADLVAQAARLADALRGAGVRPRDRVALLGTKGLPHTTAALYGILWAGCAYVPLDPQAPPARHATIARSAGVSAIVGETKLVAALLRAWRTQQTDAPAGTFPALVLLDDAPADDAWSGTRAVVGPADWSRADAARAPHPGTEHDLAYLLYTSGSTGTPKGVMHTHRSALSFAQWAAHTTGLRADDRVSNHAPLHFDLSTFDYFATAAAGAAVYPVPPREIPFPASVAQRTARDRHSVVYATPSTWMLMMTRGRLADCDLSALRVAIYAGEVFPAASLRTFLALLPPAARCFNFYGPTETNVCTFAEVREAPADGAPSDIGRACANIDAFVVRDDGTLAAPGETGELVVRGGTVMQGYFGDEARTAQSLVQDPRHAQYPDPAYRTGDLVIARADGGFTFLGRRDHQVKIRGFRVELGEVESVLCAQPGVLEAVAFARDDAQGGAALHACIVGAADLDVPAVQRACAAVLPPYMVPARLERFDSFPRTSSGKIDRQSLTAAATASSASPSSGD